jgi:acyl-CoA thioester hydrolase
VARPAAALDDHGAESLGVEVWRGGVNTWECDENGHLNVRFYVVKAMEGLAGLAAALGMPGAFAPAATATLIVRDQHIRFRREAHPGAALHMRGAVLELGETWARLLLAIYHSATGEPAASFRVVVDHATPGGGRPFPFSRRTRKRAEALTIAIPEFAKARSVDLEPFETRASLARADELGLIMLGGGTILAHDCDVFGRMRVEQFIGRVSDSISGITNVIRGQMRAAAPAGYPAHVGGAVLEYRLTQLAWPRAGDHLVIRTGLAEVTDRTQRMVHWMMNPYGDDIWGVAEAVAATLDLDARKIIPVSPAARTALDGVIVRGLTR